MKDIRQMLVRLPSCTPKNRHQSDVFICYLSPGEYLYSICNVGCNVEPGIVDPFGNFLFFTASVAQPVSGVKNQRSCVISATGRKRCFFLLFCSGLSCGWGLVGLVEHLSFGGEGISR